MNILLSSPNFTYASAGPQLNTPGRGLIDPAFIQFSGVIELNCLSTISRVARSAPETMASLTAQPIRKSFLKASRSEGRSSAELAGLRFASNQATTTLDWRSLHDFIGTIRVRLPREKQAPRSRKLELIQH